MRVDARTHAAKHALQFVKPNNIVGLGSGSTARGFVALLGEQIDLRNAILGVCTSLQTQAAAEKAGIKLLHIQDVDHIDIAVDSADEVTPRLEMIKGGGGAHFRERVIAELSSYHVTIVDQPKVKDILGDFPLAIEIVPYAHELSGRVVLECLRANNFAFQKWSFRKQSTGELYKTDNGNVILDIKFGKISKPAELSSCLYSIRGVVDHGLFLGVTNRIVSASDQGRIVEYVDAGRRNGKR